MGIFNDAGEAFNQATDTIRDAAEQGVSDAGEAVNQVTDTFGDGAVEVVSDAGEAVNQVTDTIGGGAADVVSNGINAAEEAVNEVTDTLNNVLPGDIGKNLGLALYGILAVGAIAVFGYILWTLKPLFEIGANVSEK